MSPYIMQAPILGALAAVGGFAVTLIFCSITDAMKSEGEK